MCSSSRNHGGIENIYSLFSFLCLISVKKGEKEVDLVASLCKIYDASEDELRKIMDQANNLIETILKKKPSSASTCKIDKLDNINPGWCKNIFLSQIHMS